MYNMPSVLVLAWNSFLVACAPWIAFSALKKTSVELSILIGALKMLFKARYIVVYCSYKINTMYFVMLSIYLLYFLSKKSYVYFSCVNHIYFSIETPVIMQIKHYKISNRYFLHSYYKIAFQSKLTNVWTIDTRFPLIFLTNSTTLTVPVCLPMWYKASRAI